jgi:hypothetical protein
MSKWHVEIDAWSIEVEAEDEGDALRRANMAFNLMNEARPRFHAGSRTKGGKMKVPANVNDYVWVKLTPIGLRILKHQTEQLRRAFPRLAEFTPPPTDENGYTKYQMWALMKDFGQYMTWGGTSPFETTVFFETKEK